MKIVVDGFGTRFLPATEVLLPILEKSLIRYAAEKAIAAGIYMLIFVAGRNKQSVEDHFDANNELQTTLTAVGRGHWASIIIIGRDTIFLVGIDQKFLESTAFKRKLFE